MDGSRPRWFQTAILVAVVYLVAGIAFGALAGAAASHQMRVTWRLAAWVVSAAAFAAHIWYEQVRLRRSPATTALHAAAAAALGAFGLAVAAIVHAHAVSSNRHVLAFLVWPVVTALPAFVVALAAAARPSDPRARCGRPHPVGGGPGEGSAAACAAAARFVEGADGVGDHPAQRAWL